MIETIEPLPRYSPLSALTAEQVIELLTNYTRETGASVDILLVGALALQAYGYHNRLTRDLDAEVVGSIEPLTDYLRQHSIPADLTTNFSGWSTWFISQTFGCAFWRPSILSSLNCAVAQISILTTLVLSPSVINSLPTKYGQQRLPRSLHRPRTPPSFCSIKQLISSAKVSALKIPHKGIAALFVAC
jgi:hypothetical protein